MTVRKFPENPTKQLDDMKFDEHSIYFLVLDLVHKITCCASRYGGTLSMDFFRCPDSIRRCFSSCIITGHHRSVSIVEPETRNDKSATQIIKYNKILLTMS